MQISLMTISTPLQDECFVLSSLSYSRFCYSAKHYFSNDFLAIQFLNLNSDALTYCIVFTLMQKSTFPIAFQIQVEFVWIGYALASRKLIQLGTNPTVI